ARARSSRTVSRRSYSSSHDHLLSELPAREPKLIFDDLVPGNSHRLNVSLATFLPPKWLPKSARSGELPPSTPDLSLPAAHHLVYFNPILPADKLLPDGTDPNQSPGEPFVRRMWAGGSVMFPSGGLSLDGRRHVCVEGIRDVSIKGRPGSEKVFVGIERRVAPVKSQDESEQSIRERLWTPTAEEWGDAQLIERRNIVFMHERTPQELEAAADTSKKSPQKKLEPQHKPEFEHTFVPTPSLLFRYSALTLNAHAIHLDPHYCRT
ncbi:hypothetical protein LTS18_002396, partial [Coniosporium uncinatum]